MNFDICLCHARATPTHASASAVKAEPRDANLSYRGAQRRAGGRERARKGEGRGWVHGAHSPDRGVVLSMAR